MATRTVVNTTAVLQGDITYLGRVRSSRMVSAFTASLTPEGA